MATPLLNTYADQKTLLEAEIEKHPDVVEDYFPDSLLIPNDYYVYDYPISAKYRLGILVDPCRDNDYNCCNNTFGTPEYPALLTPGLEQDRVYKYIVLGNDSEVQKNYYLVYEDGTRVATKAQRTADDYTVWNDTCTGLDTPYSYCQALNWQYQRAPLRPPCMDNNYSLDALAGCYYPTNGSLVSYNCVQLGYYTNTYIPQCTQNDHCGTFLEIHMAHGTPYQDETAVIAEVLLDNNFTAGYSTTILPLTWMGNTSKVLCSYSESVFRIGSLVYIKSTAPVCCCPPPFSSDTRVGSFFCPTGPTGNGALAYKAQSLADTIYVDSLLLNYPFCSNDLTSTEDLVMCSVYDVSNRRHYTRNCTDVYKSLAKVARSYTSPEMEGLYDGVCPYYSNCALTLDSGKCRLSDNRFTFIGQVGIVTAVDNDATIPKVWVTFNNNRTSYEFSQEDVQLETRSKSQYEIWWVVRSPSYRTVHKKKAFNITSPSCTFDLTNNRYFPYTIIGNGSIVKNSYFG
eukprot:gene4473-4798_t